MTWTERMVQPARPILHILAICCGYFAMLLTAKRCQWASGDTPFYSDKSITMQSGIMQTARYHIGHKVSAWQTSNHIFFCHNRTAQLVIMKVFYLPTDAQENCFKRILKFTLKQLLHVLVQSPPSGRYYLSLLKL